MSIADEPIKTERKRRLDPRALWTKLGPLIGLIVVWSLFAAMNGQSFVAWSNHKLMLLQTAVVATAAIGATLIIISGGIDLSVGSSIAFGTMVVAMLLERFHMPPLLAAVGGVLGGVLCGAAIGAMVIGHVGRVFAAFFGIVAAIWLWNLLGPTAAVAIGLVVAVAITALNEFFLGRVRLSPFIVTLGMWGALRGAAKGLGDNRPIYPDRTWLNNLMETSDAGFGAVMAPGAWIMLLLAVAMAGVLRYTRFGRHVFAIGSNEETARLCGIRVERSKLMIYSIAIGCAGLAAVLQFAFLNGMGDPTTAEGYELKVIASVVIGGASLTGGEGSILGTIVGALIMTVVDNGCTKMGLDNWIQEIVTGVIIVAAVAIDQLRHRKNT